MKLLRRSAAGYVAPPCYIYDSVPAQGFGHVPIDITCVVIGGSLGVWTGGTNAVGFWHDGGSYGPTITVRGGDRGIAGEIDPAVSVPAVDASNIDGASRLGFTALVPNADDLLGVIGYEPANDADAGKEIFGIGGDKLAVAATAGAYPYASPMYSFGLPGGWSGPASPVFNTAFELSDTGRVDGQVDTVAAVPWARDGTLQDFMLVVRDAGGPDGAYAFYLRKNGADVITITTSASATRIWTPTGATSLSVTVGDRISWRHSVASGTSLAGELLWTFRATGQDATLGGGESGGEY